MSTRPPITLSIAGTDPSGGAGIHADLKTFTARGTLGTTVITALVAQNTHGVSRVYPIDVDFVADQFDSVLDDMPVDASKSGMLGTRRLVELVAARAATGRLGFFTVDPVMIATSGHRLLEADAVDAVRTHLLPTSSPRTCPRRLCCSVTTNRKRRRRSRCATRPAACSTGVLAPFCSRAGTAPMETSPTSSPPVTDR